MTKLSLTLTSLLFAATYPAQGWSASIDDCRKEIAKGKAHHIWEPGHEAVEAKPAPEEPLVENPHLVEPERTLSTPFGARLLEPSKIKIDPPKKRPNYAALLKQEPGFDDNGIPILVSIYASHDGTLKYTFFTYHNNMVTISKIESTETRPIGGAKQKVFSSPEELLTPLFGTGEDMPDGWRGPRKADTDTFLNWGYIKNIPEIKSWYDFQKISVPEIPPVRIPKCCKALDLTNLPLEPVSVYETGRDFASIHQAPPDFRYDRPSKINAVEIEPTTLSFPFGENPLNTMKEFVDPNISEDNFVFAGGGASNSAYFLNTEKGPDFSSSQKSVTTAKFNQSLWLKTTAPIIVKIKRPNVLHTNYNGYEKLNHDEKMQWLDVFGQAIARAVREWALYAVAKQLAERAFYNGQQFIRVAHDFSTPEQQSKGVSEVEAIHALSVTTIEEAVQIFKNQEGKKPGQIEWAKAILKGAKIDPENIDEFEKKIGALEEFYRLTHNDIQAFSKANGLVLVGNKNARGKALVGLDYGRGGNVKYDPESGFFILIDQ